MVLRLLRALALALLLATAPAAAHENHQREQAEAESRADAASPGAGRDAMPAHPGEMERTAAEDRPFPARLLGWLGRMHPFFVHFPIALFPVAWVALILARRRGETAGLIRALIVVAGAAAVVAAAAGWLTAGFAIADREEIQTWHRWIGTGLAVAGALVAVWAWRRRDAVSSTSMVALLGLVTLALLAQGWLGGAITHGMRHMMF